MLKLIAPLVYISAVSLVIGCLNDALLKDNQQQLQNQKAELDQLKQEIAEMQTRQPAYSYPSPAPGSCDVTIMHAATRKGGERFAANDFGAALSFYQDALTACPNSAQANLNLARTYEALGDRAQALSHYRLAATASGSSADGPAVNEARSALTRLGG